MACDVLLIETMAHALQLIGQLLWPWACLDGSAGPAARAIRAAAQWALGIHLARPTRVSDAWLLEHEITSTKLGEEL